MMLVGIASSGVVRSGGGGGGGGGGERVSRVGGRSGE